MPHERRHAEHGRDGARAEHQRHRQQHADVTGECRLMACAANLASRECAYNMEDMRRYGNRTLTALNHKWSNLGTALSLALGFV
jgi:hypothetical protein